MKTIGLVPELCVSDLDKALAFYVDVLGFTILYHRKEEKFAYLKKGNAEMMLEQIGTGRDWITDTMEYPFGRGINFQIEVEDVNGLYETVKKNNIKLFLDMEEKWYRKIDRDVGNRQFLIQDLDRYLLRFYQDLGSRPIK